MDSQIHKAKQEEVKQKGEKMKNQLYGVQAAARLLKVNPRTIQYACKRWKRGIRLAVGATGRCVLMLTKSDIQFLDQNLQRRVGRPCTAKKES